MLSLHDPLPISTRTPGRAVLSRGGRAPRSGAGAGQFARRAGTRDPGEFPVQVRALRGMAPGGIFRDGKEFRDLRGWGGRSEEHTSELQSLMRISYAVFCLKNKIKHIILNNT